MKLKKLLLTSKKKNDHFSKLMASAESAIQLMQERRTALISVCGYRQDRRSQFLDILMKLKRG